MNTIEKKLEKNTNQLNEQIQSSKQGRLKLVNDIEQLNSELARFRGFGEETQQYNEIFTDKLKMLEETMDTIKSRISSLEPQAVIVSGREILVGNFEKQMYEEASEMMASGNYSAAIQLFEKFNKKYKESSLTAYALHAKGLAYYAVQAHNSAIVTLRSIEKDHLNYPKQAFVLAQRNSLYLDNLVFHKICLPILAHPFQAKHYRLLNGILASNLVLFSLRK